MAFELRRYSTAGIAMASAGVIALSPLTIPSPDLHLPAPTTAVATRTVDLTAFVNPIAVWGDVLTTTLTDIGKLGQEYAADPFPIVRQIIANQVGYAQEVISIGEQMANGLAYWVNRAPGELRTALQQLASGQFAAGVDGLYSLGLSGVFGVLFPLLQFDVPKKIAQNVTNVIGSISTVGIQLALGGLTVAFGAEQAFANTGQQFLDAVKAGDAATAVSAVINFPATLVNAVLNGYGDSKGWGGLLGSNGFVAQVFNALKTIANAIKPPAPETPIAAKVDSAAVASAATVTATKALAPAAKPSVTAAVKAGDAEKVSTTAAKSKDSVAKEDSNAEAPSATEAEAPATQPVKVTEPTKADTSTPATDPVSAEPAKVETTKPVQKDTTKSEPGTKATGTTSSDADSAGKPDKSDKPAEKAPKAEKAQKTPKAPKVAKQPKKASSTQQSANAG